MRVIHGVWAHGALCLWAEDPDLPPVPGRARPPAFTCRSRIRSPARPPSWPTCSRSGPGRQEAVRKAVHDELILQLPTAGGGPLASPELVRPEAAGTPGAPVARFRPGAAGSRWRAGGCLCSPSARQPRSWCSVVPGWAVPGRRTRARSPADR